MSKATPYAPEPIEVTVRGGKPVMVRIKRRRLLIIEVINVWRIDEEWWRKAFSRLYFLLEVEGGMRITLFHDLENGGWYRQNWA
jgi:hypothetical protein